MNTLRATLFCLATLLPAALLGGCDYLRQKTAGTPRASIVHVRTSTGSGTGFFVEGPGGRIFVATAFHVIASGEPCTVEREVRIDEKTSYLEAFPETAVAAFSEDADLALLEIKNLPASRMSPLPLASQVKQDSDITSWGFPDSNVAKNLGLTQKLGRASNLVKLPVVDPVYNRSIKEDAVDAVIVSTDLEPGFSGGPTLDAAGSVIGVNVIKDLTHRGQNACVHASVLSQLIAKAVPAATPSAADVGKLLGDIEANYLRLPVEARHEVFPTEIVALSELPVVMRLARHLRTYLWTGASGAKLSILFARMPGELLSTYLSKGTLDRVRECEKAESDGLIGLASAKGPVDCRTFEVRPLTWDFVSASLQWAGQPRTYSVGKIDEVSSERHIYRAQVGTSADSHIFPVYFTSEAGRLRLRLTDESGKLYALSASTGTRAEDLYGKWEVKSYSVPGKLDVVRTTSESLELAPMPGGKISASQTFVSIAKAPNGKTFVCNAATEVRDVITQEFAGTLEGGVLSAGPVRAMQRQNPKDCPVACGSLCASYSEDTTALFKRIGSDLLMYRTSGNTPVEAQRFVKSQ